MTDSRRAVDPPQGVPPQPLTAAEHLGVMQLRYKCTQTFWKIDSRSKLETGKTRSEDQKQSKRGTEIKNSFFFSLCKAYLDMLNTKGLKK